MYHIVQRILLILFALSVVLFCVGFYQTRGLRDSDGPTITMEEKSVTISVTDGEESILRGVRAQDRKDGDVSSSLVIQGLSNFVEKGWRQATIAAFDSNNNVTKETRDVYYSDYVSPRFSIERPLIFMIGEREAKIVQSVHAEDCLDGDLSGNITVELEDPDSWLDTSNEGEVRLVFTVVNSAGDVSSLPVTVQICSSQDYKALRLQLSNRLVYLQRGDPFDPKSYISGMQKNNESVPLDRSLVSIDNPVDTDVPGVYEVRYTVKDESNDLTTTRYLHVIVE